MCLDNGRILDEVDETEREGWKLFALSPAGALRAPYRGCERELPEGTWLDEKDFRGSEGPPAFPPGPDTSFMLPDPYDLLTSTSATFPRRRVPYPYGWHVYRKRPRLKPGTVLRRVRYRGVRVEGWEKAGKVEEWAGSDMVDVARELWIKSDPRVQKEPRKTQVRRGSSS